MLKIEAPLPRRNVSQHADTGDIPDSLLAEMRVFYSEDYAFYDRLDEINAHGMDRLRAGGGFKPHPDYLPQARQA